MHFVLGNASVPFLLFNNAVLPQRRTEEEEDKDGNSLSISPNGCGGDGGGGGSDYATNTDAAVRYCPRQLRVAHPTKNSTFLVELKIRCLVLKC